MRACQQPLRVLVALLPVSSSAQQLFQAASSHSNNSKSTFLAPSRLSKSLPKSCAEKDSSSSSNSDQHPLLRHHPCASPSRDRAIGPK